MTKTLTLLSFSMLLVGTLGTVQAADPELEALEEQAFKQAAALAAPSIVRVQTVGGLDRVGQVLTGTGPTTGVIVSEDGYIISSAFHFVSRPASVLVQLPDGRRFAARQIATDHLKMLTLLKIDASGLTPAQAAPKESIRVGQWAIALGRTWDLETPSVSVGIVSALERVWGKAIQTDAKVSPVNYGGPLVNIEGKVMGVLVPLSTRGEGETAGVEWYDSGIGFAVPLEDVYAALPRLKTGRDLHPGLMGISFKGRGVVTGEPVVDRVRAGSPAETAGIKPGDRLVEVDGRPVRRVAEVRHALGDRYAGETIKLVLRRGEETVNAELTLTDKLVAYESGFLGILPIRPGHDADGGEGVGVRFVFSGSPAEKAGLAARDRIVRFNGIDVGDPAALLDLVSRMRPGKEAALEFRRGKESKKATVELASIPQDVPGELRTAPIPPPEKPPGKDAPQTGRFTFEMPAHERECWAFVPEDYNTAFRYGLMVWVHPDGDTMEAAVFRHWQDICRRRGILILAPKAEKIAGWTPNEVDFLKDAVDEFVQRYAVDPARVFVHSFGSGGRIAFQAAFKHRETFPGVAVVASAARVRPPENSPEYRQQYHLVCGKNDPAYRLVQATVQGLQRMKYPASFTTTEAGHEYASAAALEEIGRWADLLDRI